MTRPRTTALVRSPLAATPACPITTAAGFARGAVVIALLCASAAAPGVVVAKRSPQASPATPVEAEHPAALGSRQPETQGVSPPGPPPWLVPAWTATLPAVPVAAPAFDATQAYLSLRDGSFVAVSLADGATRWSLDLGSTLTPATGDGLVFVSVGETIEARSPGDGSLEWRLPIAGTASAPLLWNHGWLMVVTARGEAFAIRARDGQKIWQATLGSPSRLLPSLAADRAYFSLDDGRVVVLALNTGRPVWERKLGGPPAQVLPLDDRLFVGSTDNFFYCLATDNGRVKWRWRTGADVVGLPVVDGKSVYFVSLDNVLRALDRRNGHLRWKSALPVRPMSGPIQMGDLLLVSSVGSEASAYRMRDGVLLRAVATPAELAAPPYLAPPDAPNHLVLVIATAEGQLEALVLAPVGRPVSGLPLFVELPAVTGTLPVDIRSAPAFPVRGPGYPTL